MPQFTSTRQVRHSARQMFDLVADIEAYPQFVPLCEGLTITSRSGEVDGRETITADMVISYKLMRETVVSDVVLDRKAGEISVEGASGPLSKLENHWRFRDLEDGGSEVEFTIVYAFSSMPMALLMGAVFEKAFARFSGAFEKRADEIYGA